MQKLFNKVLVPVDFSEKSRKAVEKSLELAAEYHCSVHLLYVNSSQLTALLEADAVKPVASGDEVAAHLVIGAAVAEPDHRRTIQPLG